MTMSEVVSIATPFDFSVVCQVPTALNASIAKPAGLMKPWWQVSQTPPVVWASTCLRLVFRSAVAGGSAVASAPGGGVPIGVPSTCFMMKAPRWMGDVRL